MATTNFTTGTVIEADWLNDADAHVYDGMGAKHTADKITVTPAGNITSTEVQSALEELDTNKMEVNATISSISSLGTAADKYLYTTGVDTWAEGDITAAGRALLDDVDAATQRATLDLEPGTDVLAYVAPGSSGNLLTSNGSAWTSAAPVSGSSVVAWVNFNGTGTVAIREDYNVDSITDHSTGIYTINFTNALTDANYAIVGMAAYGNVGVTYSDSSFTQSTTAVKIKCFVGSSSTAYDPYAVNIIVVR